MTDANQQSEGPELRGENLCDESDKSGSPQKNERPFSAIGVSRRLLRSAQTGALATVMPDTGAPFASLVTLATDPAGAPLLLLSDLAVHTRNIKADPRISLLVEEDFTGNPLACTRVTISGIARKVLDADRASVRRRFIAKHPDSAFHSEFEDFAFYSIEIDTLHLVAGFGRIIDITAKDVLIDCRDCADLLEAEAAAVAHMNDDHRDAIELYATKLADAPPGDWRITGLDPDGLDLRLENSTCRVAFPDRVRGAGPLRSVLKRLADQARP